MAKEMAAHMQQTSTNSSARSLDLSQYPYLAWLEEIKDAYPPLCSLLNKLKNTSDEGRKKVVERYKPLETFGGSPGRCAVLSFYKDSVTQTTYNTAEELDAYLTDNPAAEDSGAATRRLFILEDLDPSFVDVLGQRLHVDPLVFSEQMNTWNFTDSQSVPHRSLPSLRSPQKSLTLRYYEIRTLDDEDCIQTNKNQMTHAVNRRKIERWRDVDLPSIEPDRRHAFVRRCASFWSSKGQIIPKQTNTSEHAAAESGAAEPVAKAKVSGSEGWDAVMLVDPAMNSCKTCQDHNDKKYWRAKPAKDVEKEGIPSAECTPACLLLEDKKLYTDRKELWTSRMWNHRDACREARHNSKPYHGGCPTLVPPTVFTKGGIPKVDMSGQPRNMASPFDELVLYWVQCAAADLIAKVHEDSFNSTFFLLKFVAQHWCHQLELIAYGVANSEWFADDHEASIDAKSTLKSWKEDLKDIAVATKDINYMRRQINHFERVMTLNIERLGVQLGCESIGENLPMALEGAQRDFLTISARLTPFRERVDDLSSIANEVASLRAAFKSIQDGEQGLRLSLFASVIFPLTLVASMLSMGEDYLPGKPNFWVFWAGSIPLAFVIGVWLMFGHLPERMIRKAYQQVKPLKRNRQRTVDGRFAAA